jgi:nucleotide-binding universal stress UspA family protein
MPLEPLPVEIDTTWHGAERDLADFVRQASLGNTPHEMVLERGDLWAVVENLIREHQIDLVVTGSRGRQGLSKLVLGSSAEKIYRRATCPVLTVGPAARPVEKEWKLKKILFPTDGSETSLKALPYALSLAEENEATLIFLRLMPLAPAEFRESDEASVREALRPLVPPEAEAWCKPEFVVRFEFPEEGILRLAREREVDLIVMGVRAARETAIPHHLPWPIASHVVAEAPCPVLTVRG